MQLVLYKELSINNIFGISKCVKNLQRNPSKRRKERTYNANFKESKVIMRQVMRNPKKIFQRNPSERRNGRAYNVNFKKSKIIMKQVMRNKDKSETSQ